MSDRNILDKTFMLSMSLYISLKVNKSPTSVCRRFPKLAAERTLTVLLTDAAHWLSLAFTSGPIAQFISHLSSALHRLASRGQYEFRRRFQRRWIACRDLAVVIHHESDLPAAAGHRLVLYRPARGGPGAEEDRFAGFRVREVGPREVVARAAFDICRFGERERERLLRRKRVAQLREASVVHVQQLRPCEKTSVWKNNEKRQSLEKSAKFTLILCPTLQLNRRNLLHRWVSDSMNRDCIDSSFTNGPSFGDEVNAINQQLPRCFA